MRLTNRSAARSNSRAAGSAAQGTATMISRAPWRRAYSSAARIVSPVASPSSTRTTAAPGRSVASGGTPYVAMRRWISFATRSFAFSTSAGESPSIATERPSTIAWPSSSMAPKANSGAIGAVSLRA